MELDDTPVASTSKLPGQNGGAAAVEVKETSRSPSPDRKGKRKAVDEDDEVNVKAEDGDGEVKVEEQLDPNEEILLGSVPKANLVGLKYAGGIRTLKHGMALQLRRDPQNITDPNALEVRHPGGLRIGFAAKDLSKRLSPLIKEKKIRLTATAGEVPPNTVGVASIKMHLEVWGQRKYAGDKRLDWLFTERREKNVEKSKQEKALKEVIAKQEGEEEADFLERMKKKGLQGAEGEKKGSGGGGEKGGKAETVQFDLLMSQSLLLDKKKTDFVNDMFKDGEMDPANLPTHPCPPGKTDGAMRTNLLEFQKQGLAWMIRMEHPELPKSTEDKPVQLWAKKKDVEGKTFWHNVATGSTQREKPILKRGGILADEMGLGKTMQTISLICTDDTGEGVLDEPEEPDERFDDMTLIVCPLSVASNWTDQFQQHVGKKRLKWHFYHGEGRELSKKQLREFDVVIATYQTLAGGIEDERKGKKGSSKISDPNAEEEELSDSPFSNAGLSKKAKKTPADKKDSTLHAVKWRRVVLDEGHLIKNPKAKMSRACADLKAERRWILTGTPIINAAGDLGAMIHFLRMCKPLDDPDVWRQHVGKGGDAAADLLKAVVLSTTLRRTKDMVDSTGQPLIRLPKVSFYQHKVTLKPAARELYDEVEKEVAENVKASAQNGDKIGVTHLLCLLLRMRQLACDPTLCPQEFIEDMRDRKLASRIQEEHSKAGGSSAVDQLPYLRDMLRQAQDEDCMACGNYLVEPRITICQHIFCQSCIEQAVESGQGCPQCGWALKPDQIIEPAPSERSASPATTYTRGSSVVSRAGSLVSADRTAKMEALIGLLKATPKGVKSLVFSQWTTHLDRIEAALNEEGIATCRFDGSMIQSKREEVIKQFSSAPVKKPVVPLGKGKKKVVEEKPAPMVMLLSLKAGALGLNLTVASQVFLMDPWWQAAIEHQAIDRVNRIGQTRDVRVFQLVADNTVESRVLTIQAKKEALIAQAFSGSKNAPRSKEKIESKLEDLKAIFGL